MKPKRKRARSKFATWIPKHSNLYQINSDICSGIISFVDGYRNFATALAKKAGGLIKSNFSPGIQTEWKDEDNTPLTAIDTEINSLVIKSIKEKFPQHSILAEEGSELSESDYVWVCDPIDGTIPYSSGLPVSVFTLSLCFKGDVILGTIYDPYMDRYVIAEKGKGAFMNGKKICVSTKKTLNNSVIDIESWPAFIADMTPLYKEILSKGGVAIMIRSVVYAGMLVGMGQFSGICYGGKSPWDAAAVKIIVEEAGGKVTDLQGNDQRYDRDTKGYIASNGLIHDELLQIVKSTVALG